MELCVSSYHRPPLCWSLGQLALSDLATAPCLADMTLPLTVTVCDCDPIEFELESGLVKVGGNVAAQDGRHIISAASWLLRRARCRAW